MGLFDQRNLFELKHPDFPGERLIACRNMELAHRRSIKRESLLKATVKELDKVKGIFRRGRLGGKKEIDERARAILENYRIGKHFELDTYEGGFKYFCDNESAGAMVLSAKLEVTGDLRQLPGCAPLVWPYITADPLP